MRKKLCVGIVSQMKGERSMIKIAIYEEAREDLEILEQLLEGIEGVRYEYDVFCSSSELLYNIVEKKKKYGLYLLALESCEVEGAKLAEEIRKIEKSALIVFVSESIHNIHSCLDSFMFNYLIKPVAFELLLNIVKKADIHLETSRQFFSFILRKTIYCIPCEKILYIEMNQRKVCIYTTWGVIKGNLTMKESLAKIDENFFVQTHRSYIVNLRFVLSVKRNEVEMINGKKIGISRSFERIVQERCIKYYSSVLEMEK